MQKTIKYKDIIITDSENTKKDIDKFYPGIENKIYVLYPGIDKRFRKIDSKSINLVLNKYGLKHSNYLLYVGAIEPRKNLELCIRVYAELLKKKKFKDYKFLIVGRAGWKNEKVYRLVQKMGLEAKVIFVGYVNDEDLPYFYNGARLLIYLSFYEGFGLPPLEALFCQTKVLAANNSSLREIISDQDFLSGISEPKAIVSKAETLIAKKIPGGVFNKYRSRFNWNDYAVKFVKILAENNYF